jgi:hypothetical membrane protein
MSRKEFLIRFLGFVVIAVAAGPFFALTFNALVLFDVIPQEVKDTAFGNELIFKSVVVWCGSLILGFIGIFPKESWRHVLYFSPIYAPSLYAAIYTLAQ